MQDGASPHTSNATFEWLSKKLPKKITYTDKKEWPPRSPDLNPIENLWAILEDKVVERQPQTQDELCEVLQEEWWNMVLKGALGAVKQQQETDFC